MAERWYARLSRILGFQLKERQPLVLYASHAHFQQTNTIGGAPGEGTGGVTEAFKRRIVLPVGASLAETDHVLGHELVHAFQYAMTGQGTDQLQQRSRRAAACRCGSSRAWRSTCPSGPSTRTPRCGCATRRARRSCPPSASSSSARYFPYRYGQALWAYLAGRFGDQVVGKALRGVGPRSERRGRRS